VTTVGALLGALRARLAHLAEGPREAELLVGAALGVGRARLIAYPESAVTERDAQRALALAEERARGRPVAQLLGRREFWSLELEVTEAVLVPRPETELLVELGLAAIAAHADPRVADLGAGSGAIGLAIAHERSDARVELIEQSPAALAVACGNARRLGVANVVAKLGDWCAPLVGRYELILANPPYLAADDAALPGLAHEPRAALVAGATGIEALARIAASAPAYLASGGLLALEHGADQGEAVRALLARASLGGIATARDLAGHERVTHGRRTG
jgi:release factor glutamine methyltransferase